MPPRFVSATAHKRDISGPAAAPSRLPAGCSGSGQAVSSESSPSHPLSIQKAVHFWTTAEPWVCVPSFRVQLPQKYLWKDASAMGWGTLLEPYSVASCNQDLVYTTVVPVWKTLLLKNVGVLFLKLPAVAISSFNVHCITRDNTARIVCSFKFTCSIAK